MVFPMPFSPVLSSELSFMPEMFPAPADVLFEAETVPGSHRIPGPGCAEPIMAVRIRVLASFLRRFVGRDRIRAHPRLRRNWYLVGDTTSAQEPHPASL